MPRIQRMQLPQHYTVSFLLYLEKSREDGQLNRENSGETRLLPVHKMKFTSKIVPSQNCNTLRLGLGLGLGLGLALAVRVRVRVRVRPTFRDICGASVVFKSLN